MHFSNAKFTAIIASVILATSMMFAAPIPQMDISHLRIRDEELQARSPQPDGPPPVREDDACLPVPEPTVDYWKPHLNYWILGLDTVGGVKGWRSSDWEKGWTVNSASGTDSKDKGLYITNAGAEATKYNMFRVNIKGAHNPQWYSLNSNDYCTLKDIALDEIAGIDIHTQ